MYDYAYQAGFRTVFMSMNANNSNNSLSIQTNAAMLQTLFPTILSHFGVSKVYFVAHSKGGLDLESAIANPEWIGIANAVLELGTPNQGDALADWIFSPAGKALGQLLGPSHSRSSVPGNRKCPATADTMGSDFPKRQNSLLHVVRQYLCLHRRSSGLARRRDRTRS